MVILDTHAWFQWLVTPEVLPTSLRAWLDASSSIAVSAASAYEIAQHVQRGRVQIQLPLQEWFDEALAGSGLELLPLTPPIAARAAFLPQIHRDPWDRLLIATALEHDAFLVTKDLVIPQYPDVKVIWNLTPSR